MFSLIKHLFNISIFCRHQWEYWDVKLRCDHKKTIDGTILNNNIRKCSKCNKQEQLQMIPKNFRWIENYTKLPTDTKLIETWVNVYGKKNKAELREDKINSIIKKA